MNSGLPDLFALVQSAFRQNGWEYEAVPGLTVVETGFEARHGRIPLHVQAFPEIRAISVVANLHLVAADPDRRARLAELLMRANSELTLGAFELRWDEGQPLFRISHFLPRETPTQALQPLLTALVEIAIMESDRLMPLLQRILETPLAELPGLDLQQMLNAAGAPGIPTPDCPGQQAQI